MVQIRNIFGSVMKFSKPIRRTRSSAISEPVESQTLAPPKPVMTDADPRIGKLVALSNNPMFTDLKKDEEEISRRISEIKKDKNKILNKIEAHLKRCPNYSVIQAINWIENLTLM